MVLAQEALDLAESVDQLYGCPLTRDRVSFKCLRLFLTKATSGRVQVHRKAVLFPPHWVSLMPIPGGVSPRTFPCSVGSVAPQGSAEQGCFAWMSTQSMFRTMDYFSQS